MPDDLRPKGNAMTTTAPRTRAQVAAIMRLADLLQPQITALVPLFDQLADAHLDGADLSEDERAVERAPLWDELLVTGYHP